MNLSVFELKNGKRLKNVTVRFAPKNYDGRFCFGDGPHRVFLIKNVAFLLVQIAEKMKTENVAAISHVILHKKWYAFRSGKVFFQPLNRAVGKYFTVPYRIELYGTETV